MPHRTEEISSQVCRRLKALRRSRGWSLEELSQRCGVSRSMISQIEREEANPTLAVTLKLAQAFGLSLGELVEDGTKKGGIEVIRGDDPNFHYRAEEGCQIRTLSPLHLEKEAEFYEVRLGTGKALRSSAHARGTREFLTVEKGTVSVAAGDHHEVLEKGDSASYPADVPHAICNEGRGEALLFLVDLYPSDRS
ncbi:MAG: XRE family transcriptional regulator [Verrucomicrobiota bacterium]